MRVTFAISVLVAGCLGDGDPRRRHALADDVVALRERMHARFAHAATIRDAVMVADVDRAHAEAVAIAQLDEPHVLSRWQPYLDNVKQAAVAVEAAPDTIVASRAIAELGHRCAACHSAAGATIVLPAPTVRDAGTNPMAKHAWAAARMWDGLIAGSAARWREGADVLAESDMVPIAESGRLGLADNATRVRVIARHARDANTSADRAETYGLLLATCARCHATIRD